MTTYKEILVAIYVRVSTTDQAEKGYSLDAQRDLLTKWAGERDYGIYYIYADEGISGKDIRHRPGMIRLLSDASERKFEIVVVWALSRLTRSVADLYITYNHLHEYGISLVSYTESIDTDRAYGRAMLGMLGIYAQLEREMTAERVIAAMTERARQGKRTCHDVLGYDLSGKDDLSINNREANIVKYIYTKYQEHKSLTAVAELCNIKGYRGKRGSILRAESLKRILTRPIYVGYNSFKGNMYLGRHQSIVDLKSYNQVQLLLKRPILTEDSNQLSNQFRR